MIEEQVKKPIGELSWVVYDEKTGKIKTTGTTMNKIMDAHKNSLATQVDSTPAQIAGLYQYIKCGTGVLGPTSATNLTTPCTVPNTDRYALTSSTSSGAVVTNVYTFTAGQDTAAITEIGVFTTLATATMMSGATVAITKGSGDALTVTWTITFS
jgi:hypothetical protein